MQGLAYYVIIQHTHTHTLGPNDCFLLVKKQTKTHLTQPLRIKAKTLSNEHVALYLCPAKRVFSQ